MKLSVRKDVIHLAMTRREWSELVRMLDSASSSDECFTTSLNDPGGRTTQFVRQRGANLRAWLRHAGDTAWPDDPFNGPFWVKGSHDLGTFDPAEMGQ